MKQQIASKFTLFTRKTVFTFLLPILIMLSGLPAVQAQEKIFPKNNDPVIKYVGIADNKFIFQFDYANESREIPQLLIKDEKGTVLYKELIKDKAFSKKFVFNTDEVGNQLYFVLTGKKERQRQVFEVNIQSRIVEDVVIVKQ